MKFAPNDLPVRRIEPHSGWMPLHLHEVYEYRRLLAIFVWRDVKARYKQTAAGISWVILQPLVSMLVFSLFFGRLLQVPSGDLPYPIFAFCALVPWTYFVHALTVSSMSVVNQYSVISKTYFPRLLLPLSAVLGGVVDLFASMVVLIPLMAYYGLAPGPQILALPLFVLLAALTALGVGLWLAAINVRYRDVNHALPFLTQLWLFVTPVAYPISIVPQSWRPLYELNPMVVVVEGFRWSLSGDADLPVRMLLISGGVAMAILVSGLYWFRREEINFSDVI